jgi:hypothetical protein
MNYTSADIDFFSREFLCQAALLNKVKASALPSPYNMCDLLVSDAGHDAEAITLLCANGYGNQAAMVFRGFLEKIVTYFYVFATNDDERKAYIQYSMQKTYQLTRGSGRIESKRGPLEIKFTGSLDYLMNIPEYKAAVDRFTSPSGKPKTRWSNTSIEKKLEAIKKADLVDTAPIELLLYYIYDNASEALHGTLYGCLFHLGMFQPGKPLRRTHEEQAAHYAGYLATSFILGASVMNLLLEFLCPKTDQLDILAESKASDEKVVARLKEVLERKAPDPTSPKAGGFEVV